MMSLCPNYLAKEFLLPISTFHKWEAINGNKFTRHDHERARRSDGTNGWGATWSEPTTKPERDCGAFASDILSAELAGLLGALQGGQHEQYLENPQMLGQPQTVNDGNAILGHLFGSKDVSRAVAGRAAEQTGIGSDVLKKLLPLACPSKRKPRQCNPL